MPDYTTTPASTAMQRVAITSIDVINRSAGGQTRWGTIVTIHTGYSVGGVQVTPSLGDQWYCKKVDGDWRLDHRVPFNDPNQLTVPTQGQVQVGSGRGPVELNATIVNANAPLSIHKVTTSTRPEGLPVGTQVFDTSVGAHGSPIWFAGGGIWVNGAGTSV